MDPRGYIAGQLRECYARVIYSHKTHEKCADILLSRLSKIKLAQIILASLTTVGFISVFLGTEKVGSAIGGTVSAILLILNTYAKDYDLGTLAQKHRQSGVELLLIREQYLALITDLLAGDESIKNIRLQRDALLNQLHSIYAGAPDTNIKAYKKAQKALQQMEEMTLSDEEIDELLPRQLRLIRSPPRIIHDDSEFPGICAKD